MKQGWEIKKLGEVCDIINGFAFKSNLFTDEGENILRISNIQNGYVDLTDIAHFNKTDYPKVNLEKYAVIEDDIVVALSGATTGKFGINKSGQKLYLNQRVAICRENTPTLNHLYLLYYLRTQAKSFLESAEGVAQPNLSTEQMKQYDISVPPIEEQERIVAELDCLSGVIEKKREQLKQLDALAQSIFYQMFGDPITNEKGWEVKKLGDIATSQIGITYKPENVSDNNDGTIVLRSSNIQESTLCFDDIVRVKCDIKANKYVQDGDILMCSRNGSFRLVGKVAMIANLPEPITYGAFMTIIRSPYQAYLFAFFKSPAFRSQLTTSQTATINQITVKMLNEIKVALPPMEPQQEFADKIEAIEKQKELIKQSITETEELFNSRMSYYFN